MSDADPSPAPQVLMWEARAAAGRLDELVAWVDAHGAATGIMFCSADPDPRVVLVDPTGRGLPDPPPDLVARAPHAWPFDPVVRRHTPTAPDPR